MRYFEVPMHVDMSPYAGFYLEAIEEVRKRLLGVRRIDVVELGTRHGCSARILQEGLEKLPNWRLVLIDLVRSGHIEEVIRNANTYFWQGDVLELSEKFKENTLAMIHVDVDPHEYEQTKEIFSAYEPKLRIGGMFVFHDCTPTFGVKKFVDELDFSKWDVRQCEPHRESYMSAPAWAVKLEHNDYI